MPPLECSTVLKGRDEGLLPLEHNCGQKIIERRTSFALEYIAIVRIIEQMSVIYMQIIVCCLWNMHAARHRRPPPF